MLSHNYIIFPINRIRKFLLNPFFFVIIFSLFTGISIITYQGQSRHEPGEAITQQRRENLDDVAKITTITALFFAVFNWLSTSDISRKQASLKAVENFKEEYINFCKARREFGINEDLSYQKSKAFWEADEKRHEEVESIFNSILNSCEVLSIEMNYGVIDESIVKTCLIGAFLEVLEWLLEYIEEKQHEHPGRWINCLETVSRWHTQKSTFDIQAMIEKTKFESLIEAIRTHQMLSATSEKPNT